VSLVARHGDKFAVRSALYGTERRAAANALRPRFSWGGWEEGWTSLLDPAAAAPPIPTGVHDHSLPGAAGPAPPRPPRVGSVGAAAERPARPLKPQQRFVPEKEKKPKEEKEPPPAPAAAADAPKGKGAKGAQPKAGGKGGGAKAKAKAPAAARVTAQGRAPMPPPEASEGGGSHEFKFGDEVEVAGAEAGYEGSWYLAEVVDAKDSAAVLVQYEALYQDDGSTPLTERIKASRLRPTPPPPAADWLGALAGGAACELRHEDGWWEVEYVSATSGGAHLVYSKAWQRKVSAQHANLRPGWKWTARSGKWGTRAKLGGPKAAGKKA
jgi:hypothetical protein